MRAVVILIATLLHYGECQSCVSGLKGWTGTLYYPQMKGNQQNRPFYTKGEDLKKNCVFYLNAIWPMEIQLTVGMIKVGPANVLIKTFSQSTKKWEVLYTVTGIIPSWIDLTARDTAYLKIVVPKDAGSFFIDYKLNTCPPLPIGMKVLACTKDRHLGSHCVTECGEDYYSKKINENKFHTRCLRKRIKGKMQHVWSYTAPATEKICVSKTTVHEQCFNETSNPNCPYNFNDLLHLMGERYRLPKREPRPTFDLGAGSRSLTFYTFRAIPPKVVNHLLVNVCKKKFCGVDPDTEDYVPVCSEMKRPKPKLVCMMCRHSKPSPCEGSSGIVNR